MKSKYQIGLIGVRLSTKGASSKLLKNLGAMKCGPQELNNRNAFDAVIWTKTEEEFKSFDLAQFAAAGASGFAVWITDAQWRVNDAVTDRQWINRRSFG